MNTPERRARVIDWATCRLDPKIINWVDNVIAEHENECYKSLAADLPERQVNAEAMLKEGRGSIDAMLVKKRWWRKKR